MCVRFFVRHDVYVYLLLKITVAVFFALYLINSR